MMSAGVPLRQLTDLAVQMTPELFAVHDGYPNDHPLEEPALTNESQRSTGARSHHPARQP